MNRKNRTIIYVILLGAFPLFVCWGYRFSSQNKQLKEVEQSVPRAMSLIENGILRQADENLSTLELRTKSITDVWAAWPSIRQRERILSSHLANLRVAYVKRLSLVDRTALKVAEFAREGKIDEAKTCIQSALDDGGRSDQSLQALDRLIDRLMVQDFKVAGESARQSADLLIQQVPISAETRTILPELTAVVEREKKANYATHFRIASEVRNLINENTYTESDQFKPILKGKAMIWDATKDEVEMAYQLLPDNLRASSNEGIVTIFSVIHREQILRGHYSISGQPAYKEKMIIGVVYWPEKKNAGSAVVWGGDPRQVRPVSSQPEYGSSVNIKNWVESLPRE